MSLDTKLKLFRSLMQNQSLAVLKEQMGDEGIKVIQRIADACDQQDSEALLQNLDKYLVLVSVSYRAIEVSHAEVTTEAFNDIRDAIAPVLEEMKRATPLSEGVESKGEKKEKKQWRLRLPWQHGQEE